MKKTTKTTLDKTIKFINHSLKVDANSTSTAMAFQPKAPEKLKMFKRDDK